MWSISSSWPVIPLRRGRLITKKERREAPLQWWMRCILPVVVPPRHPNAIWNIQVHSNETLTRWIQMLLSKYLRYSLAKYSTKVWVGIRFKRICHSATSIILPSIHIKNSRLSNVFFKRVPMTKRDFHHLPRRCSKWRNFSNPSNKVISPSTWVEMYKIR